MLPLFITLQTIFGDAKVRLSGEEKGATAVEYGLLVGILSIAIAAVIVFVGQDLVLMFQNVVTALPGGNA